jgi:hypothetical protein
MNGNKFHFMYPCFKSLLILIILVLGSNSTIFAQTPFPPIEEKLTTNNSPRFGGYLTATNENNRALNLAASEVLVFDTANAPNYWYSDQTPRTYMGEPFNADDPGLPLQITGVDFFMRSVSTQTFSGGICISIQFWEDFDASINPVFSNPAGDVQRFTIQGPFPSEANKYYIIPVVFTTPITFSNLTNNGFSINYQGDNGSGCTDTNDLTSLIGYTDPPFISYIRVGSIPLSTPQLGFYQNASGRTDFNFSPSELRVFSGKNYNAIAIKIYARGPDIGTWEKFDSPITYHLQSVSMLSSRNGWAAGCMNDCNHTGNVILKWDGISWTNNHSSTIDQPIWDLSMANSTNGWAVVSQYVGNGEGDDKIMHSWDETQNKVQWHSHPLPRPYLYRLRAVKMISEDDGWAVGDAILCLGESSSLCGPSWKKYGDLPGWPGSGSDHSMLNSIDGIATNDIWAVGYYYDEVSIFEHTKCSMTGYWNGELWTFWYCDGGPVWGWESVNMVSTNDVWKVGTLGYISRWDGNDWHSVPSPTGGTLNSISMISADNGWIVGSDKQFRPILLHWDGNKWSLVRSPETTTLYHLNSVDMISACEGWAVGSGGTILHYTSENPACVQRKVYLPLIER